MTKALVHWKDLVASGEYKEMEGSLVVPLGKTEHGESVIVDLYELRHLLVCGVADSGKTALVHSVLNSLLAKNGPERLRLVICDPKQVEYQPYDALSHMLTPVITDAKKTILALKWMAKESDRRLSILRQHKVRSIAEYHEKVVQKYLNDPHGETPDAMPYIVTVLDDLSIFTATFPREIIAAVTALIPNAKAVGMHLLVTTSRFDAHVIPVALRERFAARLSFHMPAAQSRILMGDSSAESLTEKGAAVYRPSGMKKPITLQTALITEDEIDAHTESIARRYPAEQLDPGLVPAEQYWSKKSATIFTSVMEEPDDDMYPQALEAVKEAGKVSTSYLQRKLGIGYSRAARLVDLLEERGVIGPANGAAPRDVIDDEDDSLL